MRGFHFHVSNLIYRNITHYACLDVQFLLSLIQISGKIS